MDRCFFRALSLPDDADKVAVDEDRCMGCGVCTVTCPTEALHLERLEREPIFETSAEMSAAVAAENEAAGQKRPLEEWTSQETDSILAILYFPVPVTFPGDGFS